MMKPQSEWNYPKPRAGWAGHWDRFVGPGASAMEQWLILGAASVATLAVLAYGLHLNWRAVQLYAAGLLAFDVIGGVAALATPSAKRWYHRRGETLVKHIAFVAVHVGQIVVVALVFRDGSLAWIGVVSGGLLAACLIVLTVPIRIRRSVALLTACAAIVASQYLDSPAAGMEWFLPALFIKLIIGHSTVEEPYVSEEAADTIDAVATQG